MPTCDDCGIMFGDDHALQKHVKEWCVARQMSNGKSEFDKWPEDDISDNDEFMDTSRPTDLKDMNKTIYFNWFSPVVKSV